MFLKSVDASQTVSHTHLRKHSEAKSLVECSQFLEIAVGDIVAAPIGNSIELDAVRELHCCCLLEDSGDLAPTVDSCYFRVIMFAFVEV